MGTASEFTQQADVVVIGAGIVGCSVAYHLAQKGVRDIVVLEQDRWPEPGGSTSHASDFIYPLDPSRVMTLLSRYGIDLYSRLEFNGPCFKTSGGLEVARTQERMGELRRKIASGKSWGVEAELITPEETKRLFPFIDESRILGAMWEPSAGLVTRSTDAAQAMIRDAERLGAVQLFANTAVNAIDVRNGRIVGVQTSRGYIRTGIVVSAAGIWGPLIGRMAGAPIPLVPMHHQLVYTTEVPELEHAREAIEYPLLRDQDRSMYLRQQYRAWEIGSYQHRSLITEPEDIPDPESAKLQPSMMPFTPEDFDGPLADILELVPCLEHAGLHFGFNGLLSTTPDGAPVLGESPHVRGFWSAEAIWVKDGPGAGKLIADWMMDGRTELDVTALDIARFYPHHATRTYLGARASEAFQKVYGVVHPREQWQSSRGVRRSPFYPRQVELGAEFFETAGWERPQWYNTNAKLLEDYPVPPREGWEAMWWSPISGAEHQAMRERAGIIDLSAFVKLEIDGPGACGFLQRMAMANVDRPVGSIIYTPLLTERARIKADVTITRLAEDRYLLVTGPTTGMQDLFWLRSHLPEDGSVRVRDVSNGMGVLGLWGPRARDVLQAVAEEDVSNEAFPFTTARYVTIGPVTVLALRISYVGELGWELYIPVDQGLRVWDTLWEAGRPHDLVACGMNTYLSSMRLEKAFRLYGSDIHTEYDVYEADLARPKIKGAGFLGREAMLRIRDQGVSRLMCTLTIDSGQVVMANETPVFSNGGTNGRRWLGYVHSADYAYSLRESLALAYLPVDYAEAGKTVALEYRGEQYRATVAVVGSRPLYDPENLRVKA